MESAALHGSNWNALAGLGEMNAARYLVGLFTCALALNLPHPQLFQCLVAALMQLRGCAGIEPCTFAAITAMEGSQTPTSTLCIAEPLLVRASCRVCPQGLSYNHFMNPALFLTSSSITLFAGVQQRGRLDTGTGVRWIRSSGWYQSNPIVSTYASPGRQMGGPCQKQGAWGQKTLFLLRAENNTYSAPPRCPL